MRQGEDLELLGRLDGRARRSRSRDRRAQAVRHPGEAGRGRAAGAGLGRRDRGRSRRGIAQYFFVSSHQLSNARAVAPLARQRARASAHLETSWSFVLPAFQTHGPHEAPLCASWRRWRAARSAGPSSACRRGTGRRCTSHRLPGLVARAAPGGSIILASYAAELAEPNSRRARGFLADPRWPFPGRGLARVGRRGALEHDGQGQRRDRRRGRRRADGLRSRPARSWTTRSRIERRPTARRSGRRPGAGGRRSRSHGFSPKPSCFSWTRWHEDDLAGRILACASAGRVDGAPLPALAEEDDPLGRARDEPLWPDWFGRSALHARRAETGARGWPRSTSSGPVRRRAGSSGASGSPAAGELPPRVAVVQARRCLLREGRRLRLFSASSPSATDGSYFYVLDVARGRWSSPRSSARSSARRPSGTPTILVEDAAAGQSAIQELQRASALPIVPVKPEGSKVARAEAITAPRGRPRALPDPAPGWLGR